MTNPTAEEIAEVAKSGNTGQVKTLTDLRFEKYEARIAALEGKLSDVLKINEEYRQANSEMYAYIQTAQSPQAAQVSPTVSPAASGVPVSAQVIKDETAEIAAKQQEEANLQAVLETLGYRKPAAPAQTNVTSPANDGM